MLPAERHEVGKQSVRHGFATATHSVERAAEIDGVPQRDRGRDQGEPTRAVLLCLDGTVAQSAEAMEADGTGQRVSGLALVEFRVRGGGDIDADNLWARRS